MIRTVMRSHALAMAGAMGVCFLFTADVRADFSGNEFRVDGGALTARGPNLAPLAGGGFIAVWDRSNDSFYFDVAARRFDQSGAPVGTEFVVNTYTTGTQEGAAVAAAPNGELVVTWQSENLDVRGQRLDTSGVPVGTEFPIASIGRPSEV